MASIGKKRKPTDLARAQVGSLGADRSQFRTMAERFSLDANNIGNEQLQLRQAAAGAAGQAPRVATTAGGTLEEALRRAKARQAIVNRGDGAIRNQRLKDRIMGARSDLRKRASALDLQSTGSNIRAGVDLSTAQTNRAIAGNRADALGGVLGGLGATLKGNRDDNGSFFDFGKKNVFQYPTGVGP